MLPTPNRGKVGEGTRAARNRLRAGRYSLDQRSGLAKSNRLAQELEWRHVCTFLPIV